MIVPVEVHVQGGGGGGWYWDGDKIQSTDVTKCTVFLIRKRYAKPIICTIVFKSRHILTLLS